MCFVSVDVFEVFCIIYVSNILRHLQVAVYVSSHVSAYMCVLTCMSSSVYFYVVCVPVCVIIHAKKSSYTYAVLTHICPTMYALTTNLGTFSAF